MYARVVTYQNLAGKVDEGITIYSDSVVPAAKQQEGYRGIFLFTDRKTGKGISISLWDSEADLEAGEASGYLREQIAKMIPTLAGPPTTERYEISVQA